MSAAPDPRTPAELKREAIANLCAFLISSREPRLQVLARALAGFLTEATRPDADAASVLSELDMAAALVRLVIREGFSHEKRSELDRNASGMLAALTAAAVKAAAARPLEA